MANQTKWRHQNPGADFQNIYPLSQATPQKGWKCPICGVRFDQELTKDIHMQNCKRKSLDLQRELARRQQQQQQQQQQPYPIANKRINYSNPPATVTSQPVLLGLRLVEYFEQVIYISDTETSCPLSWNPSRSCHTALVSLKPGPNKGRVHFKGKDKSASVKAFEVPLLPDNNNMIEVFLEENVGIPYTTLSQIMDQKASSPAVPHTQPLQEKYEDEEIYANVSEFADKIRLEDKVEQLEKRVRQLEEENITLRGDNAQQKHIIDNFHRKVGELENKLKDPRGFEIDLKVHSDDLHPSPQLSLPVLPNRSLESISIIIAFILCNYFILYVHMFLQNTLPVFMCIRCLRMSVQRERDGHTRPLPQLSKAQWGQYPPSNSGYQWTCHLCQSIFGTIEQREKHQQECPGKAPPTHATEWGSRTYPPGNTGGETYPPHEFQQTSQMPDFSTVIRPQAPNTVYQHPPVAPMSATYPQRSTEPVAQHFPFKRSTQLIWLKEIATVDLQVTYIDEAEGGVVLKWNSNFQLFEGGADLSLGQHSGCLTLSTSDVVLPITPFLVEHGGPAPQKIMISSGQKRVSNPQTENPGEMDRERTARGKIGSLDETINRLTADLDKRNSELAKQRQENEKYKQENVDLSQQVEMFYKDNQKLRTSEKQIPDIPVEIEKLNSQIRDWEKKYKKLEKEVIKFNEEKIDANNYSDYLYQQKQLLEGQLLEVKEKYQESQSQIAQLTIKLENLTGVNSPPPLPTRSKPVLKEKDSELANGEVKEANLQ